MRSATNRHVLHWTWIGEAIVCACLQVHAMWLGSRVTAGSSALPNPDSVESGNVTSTVFQNAQEQWCKLGKCMSDHIVHNLAVFGTNSVTHWGGPSGKAWLQFQKRHLTRAAFADAMPCENEGAVTWPPPPPAPVVTVSVEVGGRQGLVVISEEAGNNLYQ